MTQQHIEKTIREHLLKINGNEISFYESTTHPFEKDLNQLTKNIQNWSHTVLGKAELPTLAHEANPLINKYSVETDEGCALRIVIELDALNISLKNRDAGTAALASMKLLENIWYSSIFRTDNQRSTPKVATDTTNTSAVTNAKQTTSNSNTKLYQETINNLKEEYSHCNISALRLLAASRLNVGKQELDDLNITPE